MDKDELIIHYGTKHHSGRYPWGSGERPYQGNNNFSYKRFKEAEKEVIKNLSNDYGTLKKTTYRHS